VCDIYDALTHERPYKPAFTKKESLRIIQQESDAGFWDPSIVKHFVRMADTEPLR
jgi:putative two-component system response regulator